MIRIVQMESKCLEHKAIFEQQQQFVETGIYALSTKQEDQKSTWTQCSYMLCEESIGRPRCRHEQQSRATSLVKNDFGWCFNKAGILN
jgi:hypothetical protein